MTVKLLACDIQKLIKISIMEDIPIHDVTTDIIVNTTYNVPFKIIAKEQLVACGAEIAVQFFLHFSKSFKFDYIAKDGDVLNNNDLFLKGHGPAEAILKAERSALNITQRLSGIASKTRQYIELIKNTDVLLLDTRKTTPGIRAFEKYAVKVGGGTNHRFSLSDMVMLKENHLMIEAKKNPENYVKTAVEKCKAAYPDLKVECEVQNKEEALAAAEAGADIIMLDNMTVQKIKECIDLIDKRSLIEVSGGINLSTISQYAVKGVNFISTGDITHSVKSADLSLLIEDL